MSALRLRAGMTVRALPEGDAVVAGGDGQDAVIVNATALAILDLLVEEHTEEDIAALFCDAFPDQEPAAVQRDVADLVAQLVRAGIVEPCGVAPSIA